MTELLQNIERGRIVDVATDSLEEAGMEVLDYEVTEEGEYGNMTRIFIDCAIKTDDHVALGDIESVDDDVSVKISSVGGSGVYCGISVRVQSN